MITKDKNTETNKSSIDKTEVSKDDISKLIDSMISDQKLLQNGYQTLLKYNLNINLLIQKAKPNYN